MITFLNSTNPNHFSSAAQSVDSVEPEISPPVIDNSWKSCAICLEDMADSELRKHTSCTCLLCQQCIEVNLLISNSLFFHQYLFLSPSRPRAVTTEPVSVVELANIFSVRFVAWTLNPKKNSLP